MKAKIAVLVMLLFMTGASADPGAPPEDDASSADGEDDGSTGDQGPDSTSDRATSPPCKVVEDDGSDIEPTLDPILGRYTLDYARCISNVTTETRELTDHLLPL